MLGKIELMQQRLDSRQQLFNKRDEEQERLEQIRQAEFVNIEQKKKRLAEENERRRLEKRERSIKQFSDAIENKKKEIQEKLEMRQKMILQKEHQMLNQAQKADEIRNLQVAIRAKLAEHHAKKLEQACSDEFKRDLLERLHREIEQREQNIDQLESQEQEMITRLRTTVNQHNQMMKLHSNIGL